jgi:xanthine dehydrogenase accessory factor
MKNIVESIISLLEQGESFALATIVDRRGSAPRDSGAHMVVRQDGSIFGTIGGGLMEALVKQHAAQVIDEHKMYVMGVNLTCRQAAQTDMICGGEVEVLIDFIDAKEKGYLGIYRGLLNSSKLGQRTWLVTALPRDESEHRTRQCLVKNDGAVIGLDGDPSDWLVSFLPRVYKSRVFTVLDDPSLIIEPLTGSGVAYVFGGGHIGQKLVPLLNMVDFTTVVIDDRAEYANQNRFATADQIIVTDFDSALAGLTIDEHSYIVIVTRGHVHDRTVLAQALRSNASYIGMIGSRSKRDSVYRSLIDEGFSAADLERVYSPIGLRINADSPEEIAISIIAELIKVRAEHSR